VITIKSENIDADELALAAIDAGAEDVKVENGYVEVYTIPEELEKIRETLENDEVAIESSELLMIPKTMVQLEEKAAMQILKLMERLEDIDDVQNVFSNADIPDSVFAEYQS
jgi:transcriptional/translational regulatory protein YebC/TACO1